MAKAVHFERALAAQIVMLAPMAPHFASELWAGFTSAKPMLSNDFDWDKPVLEQLWPRLDKEYLLDFNIKINLTDVLSLKVPQTAQQNMSKTEALELALKQEQVTRSLGVWVIKDTILEVKEDYEINLTILAKKPQGYENLPKTSKEKKKKKKVKAL